MDKETEKKLQELNLLEQNIQNFVLQKQAFQLELNETEAALSELNKTKDTVYRVVGQIMVQASKQELEKELGGKKKIIELRLKNIENQESSISERAEKLKKEVVEKLR